MKAYTSYLLKALWSPLGGQFLSDDCTSATFCVCVLRPVNCVRLSSKEYLIQVSGRYLFK